MTESRAPIDISDDAPDGVAVGVAAQPRSEIGRFTGRQYPRVPSEVGQTAGGLRLPTSAARWPELVTLHREAIEEMGDRRSALRVAVLELGLAKHAVGLALLCELEDKAGASVKKGRTPHPSRYRCTQLALSYLAAAAQDYKTVGLSAARKRVDLESYLASRTAPGEATATADGSEVALDADRLTAANVASEAAE